MLVFSTCDLAPLTGSPAPSSIPCVNQYSGMYSIHTACYRGWKGSGASDRQTPAAKYVYWSIFKKSRHLGFGKGKSRLCR
jgi:hypothetical protein